MIGRGNAICGSVAMVTCQTCHGSLPVFEFELESDLGAIGLCSAAECNGLNLVIAEVNIHEWQAMQDGKLRTLPDRIGGFERFHVLHIKRIERSPDPPVGISFSEYRKIYKPSVVIYSCPCCAHGEALKDKELTIIQFEKLGGQITALGGLIVEY